MTKELNQLLIIMILMSVLSCKKDQTIDYNDYPYVLAGNWVTFEFEGGNINGVYSEPFDMVTSLDPNREGYLIIDKMYASDARVRAKYDTAMFKTGTGMPLEDSTKYSYIKGYIYVEMGQQLEKISTNTYNIAYISVDGSISSNPVLINLCYQLAVASYPNISFSESDIKDVILLHTGYYDSYKNLIDTTLVLGYRKTGFENVSY